MSCNFGIPGYDCCCEQCEYRQREACERVALGTHVASPKCVAAHCRQPYKHDGPCDVLTAASNPIIGYKRQIAVVAAADAVRDARQAVDAAYVVWRDALNRALGNDKFERAAHVRAVGAYEHACRALIIEAERE